MTIDIPTPGTYKLDASKTSLTFNAKHMFGLATVTGTFTLDSGEITVADPVADSSVVAGALAASFASGNPTRDKHIRSAQFLNAEQSPQITFRSTQLQNENDQWVLQGQLTAAGATAPTQFRILEVRSQGDTLEIRATATIDRYAHEMTKKKGLAGQFINLEMNAIAVKP